LRENGNNLKEYGMSIITGGAKPSSSTGDTNNGVNTAMSGKSVPGNAPPHGSSLSDFT